MTSSIVIGTLLGCISLAIAGTPTLPGPCPDFKPIASMDGLKLDGTWIGVYIVRKGTEGKETIKCVKEDVKVNPDASIDLSLSQTINGQQKTTAFHAKPIAGQPTKFTLNKVPDDSSKNTITGALIAANDKYAVDYICVSDGSKHAYEIVVYSRQSSTLDDASLKEAKAALKAANNNDELTPVEAC